MSKSWPPSDPINFVELHGAANMHYNFTGILVDFTLHILDSRFTIFITSKYLPESLIDYSKFLAKIVICMCHEREQICVHIGNHFCADHNLVNIWVKIIKKKNSAHV